MEKNTIFNIINEAKLQNPTHADGHRYVALGLVAIAMSIHAVASVLDRRMS